MLLETVIIILREVLEASLLTSLLLALSKILNLGFRWFFVSIFFGFIGAYTYASNLSWVSEQFNYTGQELSNASIQIVIFIATAFIISQLSNTKISHSKKRLIQIAMAAAIALAITREFSEIILYWQGFIYGNHRLLSVFSGSLVGAGLGTSIGVLFYYALTYRTHAHSLLVCQCILAFVVAGIVSQAIPLFQQVDLLPASQAIWDSSTSIPENSVLGQLLYAVLGYEATPSSWQLGVYCCSLGLLLTLSVVKLQK